MRTIAIFNHKGGVGKTTTVSTMADILAIDYRKRVLVIDADPQGNLSMFYGVEPDEGNSTLDLFMGTHEPVYSDWISSARTDAPVDIIPSDTALVQAEAAALKEDARFNRHAMSDLFRAIREDADAPDADNRQSAYDYVLIDCSPAFSQVSLAALRDADDIIVPITTDLFSTMGMATVLKQIMRARKDGLNSVAGVLVNKYQRVEDPNGLLTYLRNQKAVPTFETVIRKSKKVVSAGADGVPLIKFSPRCAAARDVSLRSGKNAGYTAGGHFRCLQGKGQWLRPRAVPQAGPGGIAQAETTPALSRRPAAMHSSCRIFAARLQ